ncbi:MAG: ACT domain-containing protein [Erysipelotrichaceae bacterium]|jgi:chorismate mutase|nr:ACT domain-containing protein [Erysipelotrichaceae bacterium]
MSKDYLIVNKKILPDYLEKVIEARTLLENHEVSTVTEAVAKAGISRNTYYKYKDFVFSQQETSLSRHAVLTLILRDEAGSLSSVISTVTEEKTNILTISQALPVAGKANVLITLDITNMKCTMDDLTAKLKSLRSVRSVHLDAIE